MKIVRRLLSVVAFTLICSLAPLGHAQTEPTFSPASRQVFVGQASDRTFDVGLVAEDGRATLFACGDEQTVATHTQWFSGEVLLDNQVHVLTSGDWTAWVLGNANWVIGIVEREDGSRSWFYANRASDEVEGVYRLAKDGHVVGAIITLDEDGELALRGALKSPVGVFSQISPGLVLDLNVLLGTLYMTTTIEAVGPTPVDYVVPAAQP